MLQYTDTLCLMYIKVHISLSIYIRDKKKKKFPNTAKLIDFELFLITLVCYTRENKIIEGNCADEFYCSIY